MNAVHKLRFQHCIKTLCRVLNVNRSTYYKRFNSAPTSRTVENQSIRTLILHIYADYQKRLGDYKICHILEHNYGVKISVGRVYRLMKDMHLPKMSTAKPFISSRSDNAECTNYLRQEFKQIAPNLVWGSDITYIKAGYKWHYLCVIIDLFSRKVIAWNISAKSDTELVIAPLRKPTRLTENLLALYVPL